MKDSIFHQFHNKTPAYVYDAEKIINILEIMNKIKINTGCFLLYSIKSANNVSLLDLIKPYINGFSCSSIFELQLATELLDSNQTIHIATPGIKEDEFDKIINISDFGTLNSLSQFKKYSKRINSASCGIRINPELSFVRDERFDPCRTNSKLGIPLSIFSTGKNNKDIDWSMIEGIHIHNNCESTNFYEMKKTVQKTMSVLSKYQMSLKWFNVGGGYLINEENNLSPLIDTIKWLQDNYSLDVYIEPGKAISGNSGYLVASVIDIFTNNGEQVIVLDTTINHLPEVFEYQYQPSIINSNGGSGYKYHITGCSCLSGDLFGDYYFTNPLSLGSRIVFENVGAYMQVKANMFNGINLPSVYLYGGDSNFKLLKEYNYNSYRDRL